MSTENNPEDNTIIPLRDVTEEEAEAAAREEAVTILAGRIRAGQPFVFASIEYGDKPTVHLSTGARTHEEFIGCTMGILTALGQSELGEGAQNMPPEILHAIALSTGLKSVNESARTLFEKMGVDRADAQTNH